MKPKLTLKHIDKSTVVVIPTRGMMHCEFVTRLLALRTPLSTKRPVLVANGMEVAAAYNGLISLALSRSFPFIMTIEDDNLLPPDAHMTLLDTIGHYDAISGLYHTKSEEHTPLVFDDDLMPAPIDGLEGVQACGGIPMGCALWKSDLFREIPYPWFETIDTSVKRWTHDMVFAEKMQKAGKRCAVNLNVKVGHIDVTTDKIY